VERLDAETKELLRGDPIRGAHAFYSGSFREWWNPLRPGMRIGRRNALVGVHDKQSEFAKRAVHEWTAEVFCARDPALALSAQYRLMIRTEREEAEKRGKYDEIVIAPYTDDELARIDEGYASEPARRRGADPRWWEDVEKATTSPDREGPLRVTDMVWRRHGHGSWREGAPADISSARRCRPSARRPQHPRRSSGAGTRRARRAGKLDLRLRPHARDLPVHLAPTGWATTWLWKLTASSASSHVGDTHWMLCVTASTSRMATVQQ
jgi:hypothetical protein